MNNFLDICRVVNTLAGIQGSVDDCVNPTGIQVQVVECTRQAWVQLQMIRPDLMFLYDTQDFNTSAGTLEYSPSYIFGLGEGVVTQLGQWVLNQIIYDKQALPYVPWDHYVFQDQSEQGPLSWFSLDPLTQSLYLSNPDGIYTITCGYFKRPQRLVENTDVPWCNPMHFYAIVYKALEGLAVQTGNGGLIGKYSQEHAIAMGQFMRMYVKRKKVQLNGGFA